MLTNVDTDRIHIEWQICLKILIGQYSTSFPQMVNNRPTNVPRVKDRDPFLCDGFQRIRQFVHGDHIRDLCKVRQHLAQTFRPQLQPGPRLDFIEPDPITGLPDRGSHNGPSIK